MKTLTFLASLVIVTMIGFGLLFNNLIVEANNMELKNAEIEQKLEMTSEDNKKVLVQMQVYEENVRKLSDDADKNKKDIERMQKEILVSRIVATHRNVSEKMASKLVALAIKYEHPVFPTRHDILAIMGIESNFNPNAKSKLAVDPARGLMQVRPVMWKLNIRKMNDIDYQVQNGVSIIKHNYDVLQDRDSALMAYNIGLKAVIDGGEAKKYVYKFKRELAFLGKTI